MKKSSKISSMDLIKNSLDDKTLSDNNKLLYVTNTLTKLCQFKQPLIADDFANKSIELSKNMYGPYYPELVKNYLLKANCLSQLGDVDKMYDSLNNAFVVSSLNFKFDSFEMLEVFDAFRKFSLMIDEVGEHEIYSLKMIKIMNKLSKNSDVEQKIKLLFFKFSILDGLTDFTNEIYTIEKLKLYYTIYEELINSESVELISKIESDKFDKENMYYILYCNIKLKSFFKKENKLQHLKELDQLIQKISHSLNSKRSLIKPYLLKMKLLTKLEEDSKNLERLILNDWCSLIDLLTSNGENNLISANYTIDLIKAILTKNKSYRVRLSNLLNIAGESYSNFFEFDMDPVSTNQNYIYTELCYLGALINKDDPNMSPWNLAAVASENYYSILGSNSEKFKKATNLLESLIKQHNVQKS
jgi:hypothetical protein